MNGYDGDLADLSLLDDRCNNRHDCSPPGTGIQEEYLDLEGRDPRRDCLESVNLLDKSRFKSLMRFVGFL